MVVDSTTRRLSKIELVSVEKTLFEITRRQKSQNVPVELPLVEGLSFWTSVGQLLQQMETELAETVREEGTNAKAQLLSRRLGVARTCIRDLTRMRLNAFTRHSVMSKLMSSVDQNASSGFQRLEWSRHDPAERIFYSGISNLAEKYMSDVSWRDLVGSSEELRASPSLTEVHKPLTDFTEKESDPILGIREASRRQSDWEDPEIDEEERIRDLEVFPELAASQAESKSFDSDSSIPNDELIRIRVLKDVIDPILTSDGSEMLLTEGDVEFCNSLIAETLIAAGLAEAAPI
jgi:hypothetical protein